MTPFSHEETKLVVQSKLVHKIVYTGSTDGGRKIHSGRWELHSVTMELGGKDAAYVREDADIQKAAINLADGAFFNSGQSCWEWSESMSTKINIEVFWISLLMRQNL